MRNILLVFLSLIFGINITFGYELVLPKERKSFVNTNYAFFVGKATHYENLLINDERIYIAPNGAFAHSVKLKDGENRIVIKSNYNTKVYRFYKTPRHENIKTDVVEFSPKLFKVLNDNTPLRNIPVNYGMNRISHLFKGTNLIINGQKDGFYRVLLSKNKEAWIAKTDVKEVLEIIRPQFVNMSSETFKNATKHIIEFTEKIPYTIEETNSEIVFKTYNPFVSEDSIYTINIKKPEKYSYITLLEDGKYIFKVSELQIPTQGNLNDFTVVIDPGHGGSEKGAIGCLGDEEKHINLKIANELQKELSNYGINAILTRECDANVSLDERVQYARKNDSKIFISIHLNSIPDIKMDIHKNRGTSVYYYNPNSKELAKLLENSITSFLGTRKDGVKTASFAVIRPTDYIGVLVEVAYMTNPIDSVMYTKDDFPVNTAKAIAEGLLIYLNGNN